MTPDELLTRMPKKTPGDALLKRTLERIDDERNGRLVIDERELKLSHLVDAWMRELVIEQRRAAYAVFGYAGAVVAGFLMLAMVWQERSDTPRLLTFAQPSISITGPVADAGSAEAQLATLHRYLDRGLLPPADAVSTSELVAYFEPVRASDATPVEVRASSAPMPGASNKRLVRVTAVGATRPWSDHVPVTMVALVDVADARHLALARETLRALTRNFDADDQIAIVVGGKRPHVIGSIDEVTPTVENTGSEALALAYAAADNMPASMKHVVMLTDGACDGLNATRVEPDAARLSVLRLGKWSPERCAAPSLTHASHGVYAQADNIDEAVQLFANPLRRSLLPVVSDPVLRVAGARETRPIGNVTSARELAAGETMTAFFEVDATDVDVVATVDFRGASITAQVSTSGQDATRRSAAAAAIGWALATSDTERATAHLEAAAELLAIADRPRDGRYDELDTLLTEVRGAMRTDTRVR